MSNSNEVLTSTIPATAGKIGRLTLNTPNNLNALNLNMVQLIQQQLDIWENDDTIAAIWIEGSGDKAFCAGGDVQALYQSATANPGGPCEYAEAFFKHEYTMNYSLHRYPKPIICWGHGIVMGGGLGILAACSHRIVLENTHIAMPEVKIALYPDVGGSWFLNRMPDRAGLFLALTGVGIRAVDAVYTQIADYQMQSSDKDALLQSLQATRFNHNIQHNFALISQLLHSFGHNSEGLTDNEHPPSAVQQHLSQINQLCTGRDINEILTAILTLESPDPWLNKAKDGLKAGSPLAAKWIYQQLFNTRHASLRDVFLSELQLSTNIVRHPEFAEGVRALLIDKDKNPTWQHQHHKDISEDILKPLFKSPWEQNPLLEML